MKHLYNVAVALAVTGFFVVVFPIAVVAYVVDAGLNEGAAKP